MGEARHHTAGEGETGKPPKQERPEDEKDRKGREERKANRRETAGGNGEREWKESEKKRTGTKCDSQRGRGARAVRGNGNEKSVEFGGDLFAYLYPRKHEESAINFPERKQNKQFC